MHELTAEEVRAKRGTSTDVINRIRQRYALQDVDLLRIFYDACRYYFTGPIADDRVDIDYERYLATDELPDYMLRCGDEDVVYPGMHALNITRGATVRAS